MSSLYPKVQPWAVLVAGVLLQTAIGGIYAWSTFVPYLVDHHGLSRGQTGLIFGVQVMVFATATIPAGRLLQRMGPKATAGLGSLLFGAGYVIASFAGGSFAGLLVSLGVVTGAGIGLVYVCPLTTGMKWFPRHRGLVTGAAVAGFGLGAIVLSQAAEFFLVQVGMSVHEVFRLVGFVFGGTAFLAALVLAFPAERGETIKSLPEEGVLKRMLSPIFLVLAFGMFAGTFAGLLVSAHLKPFLLFQGAGEAAAVMAISLFAVGNTSGRLVWGFVHDKIGSKKAVMFSLGCALLALSGLAILAIERTTFLVSPMVILTGFGFGGCFVIYVSAISKVFGVDFMPRLYPVCFLGYGLAALVGPGVGGLLVDEFGSYTPAFIVSAVLLACAFAAVLFLNNRHWIPQGNEPPDGASTI